MVGLVERWNDSMALLRDLTGCAEWTSIGLSRDAAYRHRSLKRQAAAGFGGSPRQRGLHNLTEVNANLTSCEIDVSRAMAADEEIYHEAVRIFERQFTAWNNLNAPLRLVTCVTSTD